MKPLKSHPNLLLSEHIREVGMALEGIRNRHSRALMTDDVRQISEQSAPFHDAGKGTTYFQDYIEDPESYDGKPQDKAHTPLSLLLTLLAAKAGGWSLHDALILAVCAYGHHGAFPNLPPEDEFEADSDKTIDDFYSGSMGRILKKQIESLPIGDLQEVLGVDFGRDAFSSRDIRKAHEYLTEEILPWFYETILENGPEAAIAYRLKAQLLYSLLLEADKAFLAVPDPKAHLKREPKAWQARWVDQRIGRPQKKSINQLRQQARAQVIEAIADNGDGRIFSMTAPTGIGKTLLAATWALAMRERIEEKEGVPPKIVIVLPFLSIIDQTVKEYQALLEAGRVKKDGSWLLTSHSLADRKYDPAMEEKAENFFIDTWRSELVITTYDQFLMSLIGPRAKHQMRFHNLCDALIIIDEGQSIPCRLWQLANGLFNGLARSCNSRLLIMSATLPPFISGTTPLLADHGRYFSAFSRYRLKFRIREKMPIDDFCEEMAIRLPDWLEDSERVLITLNTRASARKVYDQLKKGWPEEYESVPLFFISADVTPRDRLKKVKRIKQKEPCVVVSTQCIEAGVDIDMSLVIRDFGPWDSIVQIAGRCNREGERNLWRPVEIVDLVGSNGGRYSEMIYDDISLAETRQLIGSVDEIGEEEILSLSDRYFRELNEKKNTGKEHLDRFIQWRSDTPIRELLRGKEREEHTFLLRDLCLMKAMEKANEIKDRWQRRSAWRKLAGKIARISVNIYARPGFDPKMIATDHLGHWVLRSGCYDPERGIDTGENEADQASFIF